MALALFRKAAAVERPFDLVLMDLSIPTASAPSGFAIDPILNDYRFVVRVGNWYLARLLLKHR